MRRRVRTTGTPSNEGYQQEAVQPGPRRWLRLLLWALPGVLVVAGFVLWPLFFDPIPLEPSSPSRQAKETSLPRHDPSLAALAIEEAFFRNRLMMAKTDSVALAIDLIDSVVTLDIKGVPVRTCKIESFSTSGALLRARRSPRLVSWLSRPFVLRRQWGAISKAPIKKVDAPKDTVEAEKLAAMMPPPDSADVAFVLAFTRNLTIKVSQAEKFSGKGHVQKAVIEALHRGTSLLEELSELPRQGRVSPPLTVSIKLSHADAKAIYRALPRHAMLAFRF